MHDKYESPLCGRYAGKKMQEIFSPDRKYSTWRRLWLALAESEQALGLPITDEQLDEMRAHLTDINYDVAAAREKEVRHDVMAHIYAFGVLCPKAKPIIHLGATSCYVGDNTDLILMREALGLVLSELNGLILELCDLAEKYRDLPTLAYTHFQPAQPTTFGKRVTLWLQDFVSDARRIRSALGEIKMLGCRGATGTSASFLELFDGDASKAVRLEELVAEKLGFDEVFDVSGQTYPRKLDYTVLSALSGLAQSAYKFSNDLRLMSHLREVDEPFEAGQVGSSAMAYKRNPMRSERVASLSRHVIALAQDAAMTASSQWFERTLDDSANKRISVPEAFLAVDGVLALCRNLVRGITVYPKVIARHLNDELPFIATENILMYCVKKGGDRQTLHEAIRELSTAAAKRMKAEGSDNTLAADILADSRFGLSAGELESIMDSRGFTGLACMQTEKYVEKVRREFAGSSSAESAEITV